VLADLAAIVVGVPVAQGPEPALHQVGELVLVFGRRLEADAPLRDVQLRLAQ